MYNKFNLKEASLAVYLISYDFTLVTLPGLQNGYSKLQ